MIDENDIEKALSWLVKNATPAAKARAERVYMEAYSKSLKSILMNASPEQTESGKERWAYSNSEYLKHLDALKASVLEDERNRFLTAAAEAKIECWRSMSANLRAQGKLQ
jgi:hypothetical protein